MAGRGEVGDERYSMKSTSKQKARKSRAKGPLKIRIRVRRADYSNLWWSGYTFWAREHGLWGSGADNTDASTRDMAVYKAMVESLRDARERATRLSNGDRMPRRIEFMIRDEKRR